MPLRRVLFVCYGNICRSPMAEALARKYGSDVLTAQSAGVRPAVNTTPETRAVLAEKNIELGDHMPRRFSELDLRDIDLVVNMSGHPLAISSSIKLLEWKVEDPIGKDKSVYRQVRDDLEMRVMQLILKLRSGKL